MTPSRAPLVDVRRAEDRSRTRSAELDSRHSFSFGRHYDPANTCHGVLLASNDERVQVGAGFEPHPHRDLEIVTWVVEGSLVHADSTGHRGVVRPGLAQRMSAGTGVLHSERNDGHLLDPDRPREPVRFVQMWVAPDLSGRPPSYEQREVDDALLGGALVPVASGLPRHSGEAAVRIGNEHAGLHAARLRPGQSVTLPDAPLLHLFVALGAVTLEGTGPLAEGDAVRFTGTGGHSLTASDAAEVLVWEMHAGLSG